jgi:hypothetical protein
MSEEIKNQAIEAENQKIEKATYALNAIRDKKSIILFAVPEINTPSASIFEIYNQALVMKNAGYNVKMLTEVVTAEPAEYLNDEAKSLPHESLEGSKLSVGPQDLMVIPEIFTNVMEQTKDLPCLRVALLQSVDYMLNALLPNSNWSAFNIENVVTTSETLKSFIEEYQSKYDFKINVYKLGIPDYFKQKTPREFKKPKIALVGRNNNDITKVFKLFVSKFPHLAWVTFDMLLTESNPPKQLDRETFAKRLDECAFGLWIDRLSSYGTFPLECMKSGVLPIGLVPDIPSEYLEAEDGEVTIAGFWTSNIYELPVLIGEAVTRFLDDTIEDEVYEEMEKIANEHSQEESNKKILEIYSGLLNDRADKLEVTLKELQKKLETIEQ